MPKIIVCGACGKMGKRVIDLASSDPKFDIVGAVEAKNSPSVGKDICKGIKIIDDLKKSHIFMRLNNRIHEFSGYS